MKFALDVYPVGYYHARHLFWVLLSPSSSGLGHRPFTAGTGVRTPLGTPFFFAGIAQLVERNLAKVEVASSNLVSRSIFSLSRSPYVTPAGQPA